MPTLAAPSGVRAVVRLLLDAGADPNASFDHEGWLQVPLYGAAGILNDGRAHRDAHRGGCRPQRQRDPHGGRGALSRLRVSRPGLRRLLIDAGTDPSVVDYCLGRALNFPYAEVAEMFCAHGAHASADHLLQAVWRRRPAGTVRALLDAGAPATAREDAVTALQVAVRWAQDDVAELLRERGADAGAVTDGDRALGALLAGAQAGPPPRGRRDAGRDAVDGRAAGRRDRRPAGCSMPERTWMAGPAARRCPSATPPGAATRGLVSLLVARGAACQFGDGGTAIGAALHGSRHCNHPEGGPTMQTVGEIPQAPYAEILRRAA